MKNRILLLSACLLFSCSEQNTVKEKNRPETTENQPDSSTNISTKKVVTLPYKIEKEHIFSDPTKADKFRLELTGKDVLSGAVKFTIINPAGKQIYEDTMAAGDLEASMVYEMKMPTASPEQRRDFILKRMQEFFDEKNFSTPAIAPNDAFDPAFGDQVTWQTIKNDKNAVGFNYLIGKEYGRRIAFAKLKDKVMLVGFFGG